MRKFCVLLLIFTASFNMQAQAVWSDGTFVHRSGRNIVDGAGNTIRFEGVNLGGWLMWEGWIWGNGYTAEKTIYNRMATKIGAPATEAFRDSIHHGYITRKDIQKISEQCFNVVRIPFNHNILEDDALPFVYKPQGWALLDSVLSWCEDYNVYAILDMHSTPGGQSAFFIADPDSPNMWSDSLSQVRTMRLWKAIADRYKNRGIVAGYDLLNEPNAPSDSALLAMYDRIIDSVRTVDSNHMFMIEGKSSSTDFSLFTSLPDANMSFSFHFYTWFVFNIPNALQDYVDLSQNMNVPVWCGEWGENNYAQLDTTLKYLQLPANLISGETFWTWKKHITGSNYPYYMGVNNSVEWDKSIKWISNIFAPAPTAAEMNTGIAQFLNNMKADNCIFNDTLNLVLSSCANVSVSENKGAKQFRVYPNPAGNTLYIDADANGGTIAISDALGRFVESFVLTGKSSVIDLSRYKNGIYFIVYRYGEKQVGCKIMVSK